jgi:hypothetical protein
MAKSATARKIEPADNNNIVNLQLLSEIALGKVRYVAKTPDAEVLLLHNPPLIEINIHEPDPSDKSKVACRVTTAGAALLTANQNPVIEKVENKMSYEIIDDAELPPIKRGGGGGGAPTKYPFDQLEVGKSFFVPATAKLPNPLKTLGSTISSANHRYAKVTGEKVVERSKRGARNKLVLDANGNKIMETKTVPTYEFTRKFTIRGVKAGVEYGKWVAPADGALIARVR